MSQTLPNRVSDAGSEMSYIAGLETNIQDPPDEDNVPSFPEDSPSSLDLLWSRAAGGEPHYFGASSALSFTKVFSATLRAVCVKGPGLTMSGIPDIPTQYRSDTAPAPLPDRELMTMLTTAFFEQVHPQFPFLHRPTYLQWEEEVMKACHTGSTPDPIHLFFVYAVGAIGALTVSRTDTRLPEGLYASAECLFEHVIKFNTLKSIQAILCCAMYSIRSPVGVSTWTLSGLALRQCVEMGLHRKILWSKVDSNVLKTQMRRRIFWCCYNLDRAVAVTLGRPVGISDSDIDVEYPLDIDDEHITVSGITGIPRSSSDTPATIISSAIHTIRIRQIWGRIQTFMYSQTGMETTSPIMASMLEGSFKNELDKWLSDAPEQLSSNRKHNNTFGSVEWFQLMYHHSILILHRHKLVTSHSSLGETDEAAAVYVECARSADAICQLYRQLYSTNRLNDTWGALHVLFLGGITFLYCLWMSPGTRAAFRLDKVSSTCTSCMMIFAVMAERWKAAEPYRECFDILSSSTQAMLVDSITTIAPPAMPVSLSSVHDQLPDFLSSIAELGMCSSVEALLSEMFE
ncbi:unnamed protein product [Penicillium glandicola]